MSSLCSYFLAPVYFQKYAQNSVLYVLRTRSAELTSMNFASDIFY